MSANPKLLTTDLNPCLLVARTCYKHHHNIYLGASLPDCPPHSGGKCSITLMLCQAGWLHRSSNCQSSPKWSAGIPEIQALDCIKLALGKSRPGLGSLSCSQLRPRSATRLGVGWELICPPKVPAVGLEFERLRNRAEILNQARWPESWS